MTPVPPASPDCLAPVAVAILAGGLGSRIRGVLGETPKLLAPLAGRPYWDHLLAWLGRYGARRLVLLLGHRAEAITAHLAAHPLPPSWEVLYRVEPHPLGSAGAIRNACDLLGPGRVLVINGDSFVGADLCAYLACHQASGALCSLVCTRVPDMSRYGAVALDGNQRILRFVEKDPHNHGPGYINAGLFLMEPALVERIRTTDGTSLERDYLATLPPGSLQALAGDFPFIDFGTPESFTQAQEFFREFGTSQADLRR
ncbi:MAG: NTP transferase domain-containing protein [Magnetococcales bacterium]|nr:NTP transferase domain-containing protein [Magnetococcales bacterium]